jgi:hypothetical protein
VWNTTSSGCPLRVATAMRSASATSSVRMCAATDHPITGRQYKSMTVARNSQPSQVRR